MNGIDCLFTCSPCECHFKSIWAKNGITICQRRLHISTPKWNEIKQKPQSKHIEAETRFETSKRRASSLRKTLHMQITRRADGVECDKIKGNIYAKQCADSVRSFVVFSSFFTECGVTIWILSVRQPNWFSTICAPPKSFVLPHLNLFIWNIWKCWTHYTPPKSNAFVHLVQSNVRTLEKRLAAEIVFQHIPYHWFVIYSDIDGVLSGDEKRINSVSLCNKIDLRHHRICI